MTRRRLVVLGLTFGIAGCVANARQDAPNGAQGADAAVGVADAGGRTPGEDAGGLADGASQLPECTVPGRAIITDIDATLTTSDNEFLTQIVVPGTDPAERPGAHELITAYADRGYFILYLTSRPEGLPMASGMSSRDTTLAWLTAHGFPVDRRRTRLELAPGLVFGDSSAAYKGDAIIAMKDEGFVFDYAYGNATSDIDAYETGGIAKPATFIIGPEAGVADTVAVTGDGWTDHMAEHLPTVSTVCR